MDFKPVFRMIVCSDVHYGESDLHPEKFDYAGQERDRFERGIGYAYAYADGCEYDKIDAFAAVGDFVTSGREQEMLAFKASLDKVIRKETDITLAMASHEYFYDGVDNASERFERIFSQSPVKHTVIKGFHLIGLSTDDRCQTGAEKQNWLAQELKKANADNPRLPIFMFYHPQIQNTVYGSAVLWRTSNIVRITMNYPQVIDFGGHSHACINDPRTVHQKHFTCFGTGAFIGVSCCNADRLPPEDAVGVSSLLIVEADKDGRVRVLPMNATTGKFYRDGWLVEKPWDKDSFVYTDSRYDSACAPTFDKGAKLCAKVCGNKLTVTVPQAKDGDDVVPGYNVTVKDKDMLTVKNFGFPSHYYLGDLPEYETVTVDFDLPQGEYTVECIAYSFFDKESKKLTATILK